MSEYNWLFEIWTSGQLVTMGIATVVALLMIFFAWKSRDAYLGLPELLVSPHASKPDQVITVIPARNEETNIVRVVRSFPGSQVIVVDDASTDGTAEMAREADAVVIKAPPLQRGCIGKSNACQAGAAVAPSADYLLFVGADTWYEPEFAGSLIEATEARGAAIGSAYLRQEYVSFAEKAIVPYALALYFCGVNTAEENDVTHPTGLVNGQCLLFKRTAYQFIGGHGAVIRSVVDDVELARVAKKHRLNLAVFRAESLGAVRPYDGFQAIWRGFARNALRFLVMNPGAGFQVVLASLVMTSSLSLVVALFWQKCWTAGTLLALLPPVIFKPWYGCWKRAPLAWLGISVFQIIVLNALRVTTFGGRIQWKGRHV